MDRTLSRMSYLNVSRLHVQYGRVRALDDVSLSILKGEIFSIVGPSGSGKSTLLQCIAGFVEGMHGSISVDGEDITLLPPNRREVGMVFQSYALFPHKSVFANIAYPLQLRNHSKREIRERVEELLQLVGLSGYEARMPQQLSGGQQQRVALARALIFHPRVLLLDEPLGALDRKLREQLVIEIGRIQEISGSTVLFITHDPYEAMTISDRIAVMRDGKVLQVGTPSELYEHPNSPFVASFLGRANFIKVKVDLINEMECVINCGDLQTKISKPEWLHEKKSEAMLFVRPIHVSMQATEGGHLEGILREAVYLGDRWRFNVAMANGESIEIDQPANRELSPQVGSAVQVLIDFGNVRLFPITSKLEYAQMEEEKQNVSSEKSTIAR